MYYLYQFVIGWQLDFQSFPQPCKNWASQYPSILLRHILEICFQLVNVPHCYHVTHIILSGIFQELDSFLAPMLVEFSELKRHIFKFWFYQGKPRGRMTYTQNLSSAGSPLDVHSGSISLNSTDQGQKIFRKKIPASSKKKT